MPGRQHIIIVSDHKYPLKPKAKAGDYGYRHRIVNVAVDEWERMAQFPCCNDDQPY